MSRVDTSEDALGAPDALIEADTKAELDVVNADSTPPHNEGPSRRRRWMRRVGFWILPLLTMFLALAVGYLRYVDSSGRDDQHAQMESIRAAKDGVVSMLSYAPNTAEASLSAARDRLTGSFRDSYTSLTHDVVIPGAKQKQVSTTATVSAAASEVATPNHAVVLLFVDQEMLVGADAPTSTESVVEVTLDKVGSRWLISGFEPK